MKDLNLGYASEAVEEAAADSVGFHQFLPVATCQFHLPVSFHSNESLLSIPSAELKLPVDS